MTASPHRRALPVVLLLWVLLLLPLMQVGAFAHGYGHIAEAVHAQEAMQAPLYPDTPMCEACLAFSGVTGGIVGDLTPMPAGLATLDLVQLPEPGEALAPARPPYASRAPPAAHA